ncbi:MAG: entericidin A/B family lipoprotein [Rubrimonas sp.]|uniref:entericidin A/B family lipoprotein n=1 Tax=Rubrimonas sp. TaxID=2036015 RepID=UPI002FDD4B7D
MKIWIRCAIVVFGLAGLSACNTVQGVGEDVSAGGKAITKGAEQTQKAITQ